MFLFPCSILDIGKRISLMSPIMCRVFQWKVEQMFISNTLYWFLHRKEVMMVFPPMQLNCQQKSKCSSTHSIFLTSRKMIKFQHQWRSVFWYVAMDQEVHYFDIKNRIYSCTMMFLSDSHSMFVGNLITNIDVGCLSSDGLNIQLWR